MKNISEFSSSLRFLLTDIDDTLTDEGQLGSLAYQALWELQQAGVQVIPVTGRPAGWCEMIARFWPVAGVVGENGGFYFRYKNKKMLRHFYFPEQTQKENRKKLDQLEIKILKEVPSCKLSSDQFCRLMDLAIDFCEDVPPAPAADVQRVVKLFEEAGAQAKVSSIHVNGWFGDYDKLTMSLTFLKQEFGITPEDAKKICGFCGDSPNDEPMFQYFPHSFGVANIKNFLNQIKSPPQYVASHRGGDGFSEISRQVIQFKK